MKKFGPPASCKSLIGHYHGAKNPSAVQPQLWDFPISTSNLTGLVDNPPPAKTTIQKIAGMNPLSISPFENQMDSLDLAGETFQEEAQPQDTYTRLEGSASPLHKSRSTKSNLKASHPIHDHTTDRLGPEGNEFLPSQIDHAGEKKVMPDGALRGDREYRCRTFRILSRGDKLFMLASECA